MFCRTRVEGEDERDVASGSISSLTLIKQHKRGVMNENHITVCTQTQPTPDNEHKIMNSVHLLIT